MQGVGPQARTRWRWTVHTSDHFEIFHDGLAADRVADAARQAEAAYETLSAALKYVTPRRVMLILVPRDRDLEATELRTRDLPSSGGATRRRVLMSLESLDRRGGLIVHELTHQFAFEIVPGTSRVTPVLIEGLAEHERGRWPPQDLRRTREGAAAGAIPAVARLGPADRHWAHAVFDFVAVEHGAEGIRRLLSALRAHDTLDQAVPTAFGVSLISLIRISGASSRRGSSNRDPCATLIERPEGPRTPPLRISWPSDVPSVIVGRPLTSAAWWSVHSIEAAETYARDDIDV